MKRSTSVRELNVTADQQRNREANISVGSGLMDSNEFMRWLSGNAAAERVSLALAITDIVGSTSLALDKGDAEMEKMRELHFAKTRHYIRQFDGYEIKTMGDGFMIAFRNVEQAFQFCKSVSFDTGHDLIHVRAAMHCGLVTRKGTDIFGTMVNLTSRICGYFSEAQIGLSDQAKQELDSLWGRDQKRVRWIIHERVMLKDFPERTLWTYEDR